MGHGYSAGKPTLSTQKSMLKDTSLDGATADKGAPSQYLHSDSTRVIKSIPSQITPDHFLTVLPNMLHLIIVIQGAMLNAL